MVILNRDRDKLIVFDKDEQMLESHEIKHNGIWVGIGLYCGKDLLGSYDFPLEIVREMENIYRCEYPYYVMGGFEDYMDCGFNDFSYVSENELDHDEETGIEKEIIAQMPPLEVLKGGLHE